MAPGGLKKETPRERLLIRGAVFYKFWPINTTFARCNDEKICNCQSSKDFRLSQGGKQVKPRQHR